MISGIAESEATLFVEIHRGEETSKGLWWQKEKLLGSRSRSFLMLCMKQDDLEWSSCLYTQLDTRRHIGQKRFSGIRLYLCTGNICLFISTLSICNRIGTQAMHTI